MNSDDTLFGRIKNGVLTISGNSPSIRVDGGCLIVSDGPVPIPANHVGAAAPVNDRMVTCRLRRADCPVDRIVVTRPDGFITFGAIKWLHGVGASLVQLDWDGTVLLATAPAGNDLPALRRAQALAGCAESGHAITREILSVKLSGQAAVARLLGSNDTAELIVNLAGELDSAPDAVRLLAIEAMAAAVYWPLWVAVPLRFARKDQVPEHWRTYGGRASPLSGKPLKAATPGNALLNYIYAVAVGEMTIALTGAGLDPGMGIFHADRDRRASLAYDAIEIVRPYVDGWFLAWLATTHFSKRDFYEEHDGTVRITRPLTSHLAMTAAIWRAAAQAVAGWLARALGTGMGEDRRLPPPFPALPAPKRTWQGLEPPIGRTCQECGKALAPRQRKFCSEACAISFHVASATVGELTALPGPDAASRLATEHESASQGGSKHRRHLALRRAWDAEHGLNTMRAVGERNSFASPAGPDIDSSRKWFRTTVAPLVAQRSIGDICRATGLSKRYAIMIRQGHVPHPRHYPMLAELVGMEDGGAEPARPVTRLLDKSASYPECV
jgi:CRISPR-associated endonuclease Cas1